MMLETMLESSHEFGGGGALPQWKRELLARRALRRAPGVPPSPPQQRPPGTPGTPDGEDEELRYGPGIVNRLKSRYLSLALRDTPRRATVLRRAASLEHLLDERPPAPPAAPAAPQPARPEPRARPAMPPSMPPVARRESVKRARSVDALSRVEARAVCVAPVAVTAGAGAPAPRAPRPPRRPLPLLRDAERPPPDVVRSTLRKFESGAPRRARATATAASVAAVEAPSRRPPVPPPLAAANPVLLRRVGVIRPMPPSPPAAPAPPAPPPLPPPPPAAPPTAAPRRAEQPRAKRPPAALVEPLPRRAPAPRSPPPPARPEPEPKPEAEAEAEAPPAVAAAGLRRGPRGAAGGAVSVVFNFSGRKEVPDYIENDGLVLRAARRHATTTTTHQPREEQEQEDEDEEDGPAGVGAGVGSSPVRFVNDNVLINGRSSLLAGGNGNGNANGLARRREHLKLQFDDSLTRTHEYPSETSLCEEDVPTPPPGAAEQRAEQLAEPAHLAPLAANTHIASAALARYTPSKTPAEFQFQLGVAPAPAPAPCSHNGLAAAGAVATAEAAAAESEAESECEARAWSHAREARTDLLF